MPAQINLIVPIGTLLGWPTAPAQAGAWGLLDSDETRTIVDAAAQHPRTRWCCTLTAPDGTALAHACARGRHPHLLNDLAPQPPPAQLAELLRRLNLTFTPIARGTCDHTAGRRPLRPKPQAQAPSPCPHYHAPRPRLPIPGDQRRPGPQSPLARRPHGSAQPAPQDAGPTTAPNSPLTGKSTNGTRRHPLRTLPSGRTHTTTPTNYDTNSLARWPLDGLTRWPLERRELPGHACDLKQPGRERTGRVRLAEAVALGAHEQVGAAAAVQFQDRGRRAPDRLGERGRSGWQGMPLAEPRTKRRPARNRHLSCDDPPALSGPSIFGTGQQEVSVGSAS